MNPQQIADALVSGADFSRARIGMPIAAVLALVGAGVGCLAEHAVLGPILVALCLVTSTVASICWIRLELRGAI
jgi:hypothetical protein